MGNKNGSEKEATSKKGQKASAKVRKFLTRISSSSSQLDETARNRALLSSIRENGGKPKREYYFNEKVLTDVEIGHIMDTWPHLKSHVDTICMDAFLAMFEDNPDVKDKFYDFKDFTIEDLKKPEHSMDGGTLKRHIVRVSRALAKIASNVHDLDSVMDYLQVMGKLHHQHGIQNHEMLIIGPYFVACSIGHLPSVLRERPIQESWLRLFAVIMDLMRRGYPDVELTLLPEEKESIRTTWNAVQKEVEQVGVKTFLKLFQTYSNSKVFFPAFKETPLENLTLNEALQNHGMKLMKVVEEVLTNVDHVEKMATFLAQIGREHQSIGVHKQYLDVMGPIFCQALRPILQAEGLWDNDVRTSWLRFFRIISYYMKCGYVEPGDEDKGHNGQGCRGKSSPSKRHTKTSVVSFNTAATNSNRSNLKLPNLDNVCSNGAVTNQHPRFSVTPTKESEQAAQISTNLTSILRETQGEDKKCQKPNAKKNPIDDHQFKKNPQKREGDCASRRRYSSSLLSVVTDIHDYGSFTTKRRESCHLLGVPGNSPSSKYDLKPRRRSAEVNSHSTRKSSESIRRFSDHELNYLSTGLISSQHNNINSNHKRGNKPATRPRSQSCDGAQKYRINQKQK